MLLRLLLKVILKLFKFFNKSNYNNIKFKFNPHKRLLDIFIRIFNFGPIRPKFCPMPKFKKARNLGLGRSKIPIMDGPNFHGLNATLVLFNKI